MTYDRDIRWMRRIVLVVIGLNLGGAGGSLYAHQWANAAAYLVWTLNCRIWFGSLTAQQKTRDIARLTDAAILGVLRSHQ